MEKTLPPSLKPIAKYLTYGKELESVNPLVAYYCVLHAADKALAIRDHSSTEEKQFVMQLLTECEQRQSKIRGDKESHRAEVEEFALRVFKDADDEDRAGRADKNTAKRFFAAATFLEVCETFGEPPTDMVEKRRYAMKKTSMILQAIKMGAKPEPGIPGSAYEENLDLPKNEQTTSYSNYINFAGAQPEPETGGAPQSPSDHPYGKHPAPEVSCVYGHAANAPGPPPAASSLYPPIQSCESPTPAQSPPVWGAAPYANAETQAAAVSRDHGQPVFEYSTPETPDHYPALNPQPPPYGAGGANPWAAQVPRQLSAGSVPERGLHDGSNNGSTTYTPKSSLGEQTMPSIFGAGANSPAAPPAEGPMYPPTSQGNVPRDVGPQNRYTAAATKPSAPTSSRLAAQIATDSYCLEPKPGYIADFNAKKAAQKHAKNAASALDFNDVHTAIGELKAALAAITGLSIT
mmetsp:Transcript_5108/g.13707  ORF Transcript_5108/g.13707 Transcript_5108/m.13707 type:complete len:462 (+) Transcript_5108:83-1468(+)